MRAAACLLGCLLLSSAPALAQTKTPAAQPGLDIAAVVGEEAISSYDVEARTRFIIATTKLSNTPETIKGIRPQVVRSLVDERLQLKEAAKHNITISDDEVRAAIAGLEQQRGMPAGTIGRMLAQGRVPEDTFKNQIRAQLAWSKLIVKRVRPRIKISDEEAMAAQKKLSQPQVKQELEIALLTLPVDRPKREGEVRGIAEKLAAEMRSGASFEELSRQFSSRPDGGGKVESFWVRPEQLDPSVGRALMGARAGSITPPLRTPGGWSIVKVYNTRALPGSEAEEEEVRYKDIVLKLKPDAPEREAQALLEIGEQVAKNPGTCDEKGIAGIGDLSAFDIEVEFVTDNVSALSPALKAILGGLKQGAISQPFASARGIQLYMLCERRVASAARMDLNQAKTVILQERLELEAQKYLRNLRRDTFIEIRG
jgi:peptidyl-prolyl cis-trans isomerase SurA